MAAISRSIFEAVRAEATRLPENFELPPTRAWYETGTSTTRRCARTASIIISGLKAGPSSTARSRIACQVDRQRAR